MFFKIIREASRNDQKIFLTNITKVFVSKLLENSQSILDNLQESSELTRYLQEEARLTKIYVKYLQQIFW